MKVFVDADSISVVHKRIILKRVVSENIETYFVADRILKDVEKVIQKDKEERREPYRSSLDKDEIKKIDSVVHMIIVESAEDSADNMILSLLSYPSILITHDIILSSKAIEKGALVINEKGMTLSGNNIKEVVSLREWHRNLREEGVFQAGTKETDRRVIREFSNTFDREIRRMKNSRM